MEATGAGQLTPSGSQTSGSEPTPRGEVEYLIQFRKSVPGAAAWTDADYVTVPPKTKRSTVREKAREVLGEMVASGDFELEPGVRAMVRIIPKEHSEPFTVEMEQPPPQLRIGGR